ncbi:putative pentatricopeptide repeat-containing protein At5g37570 [Selaginella moellendorffii]|uniref:putative pentatricopeptide repeat-containing protein At5g37570 n=1 Tax=Selaginella moellendorffii TaxID=88036 RepID=UPI000D1C99DA|nr:putative pentatricopeptide repeat-containing protein At5g37570 [Selaginella moellendorffii]|eukprot:XP_024532109.1 putative pentatricopeptide repeat-containing protein At5g37570 [Selaginella moellendorffii]
MFATYAQNGHLLDAREVFNDMPRKDTASWTAMLSLYAQTGHLLHCRKLLLEMPERCLVAWSSLLASCVCSGNFSEALDAFYNLRDDCFLPDEICFMSALAACSQVGKVYLGDAWHLREAGELTSCMPFVPEVLEWCCLLNGCKIYGNLELGAFAAKHVTELDPKLNMAYILTANAFSVLV